MQLLGDRGFEVITISIDERMELVEQFMDRRMDLPFVNWFVGEGSATASARSSGVGAPTQESLQAEVAAALDTLVAELVAERPADAAAYAERLRAYLDAHPAFYGSAAALVDEAGTVTASPYVYRTADGYQTLDLAQPEYEFEAQGWITMPLAADTSIWTPPYFDEGGGEIWMTTRSVPARDAGGIFAIVTTDLPVDAPGR